MIKDREETTIFCYHELIGYLMFYIQGKQSKQASKYINNQFNALMSIIDSLENAGEFMSDECFKNLIEVTMGTTRQEYDVDMYCRKVQLCDLVG